MFVGFSLKIDLTLWISNVLVFGKSIPAWQWHSHQMFKKKKSWQKVTLKSQLWSSRREGRDGGSGERGWWRERQDLPSRLSVMAAQGLWVGRDMERRRDLMQLFPKDKNLDAILC